MIRTEQCYQAQESIKASLSHLYTQWKTCQYTHTYRGRGKVLATENYFFTFCQVKLFWKHTVELTKLTKDTPPATPATSLKCKKLYKRALK